MPKQKDPLILALRDKTSSLPEPGSAYGSGIIVAYVMTYSAPAAVILESGRLTIRTGDFHGRDGWRFFRSPLDFEVIDSGLLKPKPKRSLRS
jgi:hypothetical protein